MKLLILFLAISVTVTSCGKKGLKVGKVKSKVEEPAKVAVAKNDDVLIVGDPENLSEADKMKLEGKLNGEDLLDLPLPEGDAPEGGKKAIELSGEIESGIGGTAGDVNNGLYTQASARLVLNIIDNEKNQLLWTVPVTGAISGVTKDGKFVRNQIDFNLNVQKVLNPYFTASGEFMGNWNAQSQFQRRLYGGVGLNMDILGNMVKPGVKPQVLTSFYLMGGQDQFDNGNGYAKARGSFRVELRDIYLVNPSQKDKTSVNLFAGLEYSPNLTDFKDSYLKAQAGVSVLSPEFSNGMRVAVKPSYQYTRFNLGSGSQTEHQHTFNLGFSLTSPKAKIKK